MPIPSCRKARIRVQYLTDDNRPFSVFLPADFQALGLAVNMAPVANNQLAQHPPLSQTNIKPRHLAIETTDGVDGQGRYHVYRRTVPFNKEDVTPTGQLKIGATFTMDDCNWVVRGRVGEKRRN